MRHLSLRTEDAYVDWIRRYILFHRKRRPSEMGEEEIRQFISDLAVNRRISASTQTVALSALLFLYRDVLKKELPYVSNIERAQRHKKLPVVFTRDVSAKQRQLSEKGIQKVLGEKDTLRTDLEIISRGKLFKNFSDIRMCGPR